MKGVTHTIKYSGKEHPRIIVFSCLHLGHKFVDMNIVRLLREELKKPNTYWIDLGDSCEFINLKDKRFDSRTLASWITTEHLANLPSAQIDCYARLFKDFAPTCLCRLAGNHEDKMLRVYERDVYHELNEAIEVSDDIALGYSGIVDLRLKRSGNCVYNERIYVSHGHVGGRLPGTKANDLNITVRMVPRITAAFKGHGHMSVAIKPRMLDKRAITHDIYDYEVACACTGTFKRGERLGYEERSGFQPHGLGWVTYEMDPRNGRSELSFPVFGFSAERGVPFKNEAAL